MGDLKHTSSARGKAAEFRFLQLALEEGWDVALPVSEDSSYDALVDQQRDGAFARVQIKRVWEKDGYPVVNLVRADGSRYELHDADWLAAVQVDTGIVWFVPWGDVCPYTRKRLTSDMALFRLGGGEDEAQVPH